MNFGELKTAVAELVLDTSPAIVAAIPDCINEAVLFACEEVALPSRKEVFSFASSTSTYYTLISSTFEGRVTYIGTATMEYIPLRGGLEELLQKHPDVTETGTIEDVAVEGSLIYYLPIPTTAETFTCIGLSVPATLVNDTDTPTDIPEYLHRMYICNKAAELLYTIIEDGTEGAKVNTQIFAGLAARGLDMLRAWAVRRRNPQRPIVWSN